MFLWFMMVDNNNILVNYTYLGVQTESLNAAASVALPPEQREGRDVSKQVGGVGAPLQLIWLTESLV